MRICMIFEGCYPYVTGGVSSWAHSYIQSMQEHEFVLWVIGADSAVQGKYKYELPANVVAVHEVFLNDALSLTGKPMRGLRLSPGEQESIRQLILCEKPDWDSVFSLFQQKKLSIVSFLRSATFMEIIEDICLEHYPHEAFSQFFHTIRSILLVLLYLTSAPIPQADVYHAISTGYSGLFATLGKWKYHKPMMLTEHGIYTREREEELLRATWTTGYLKEHWIKYFYMLAHHAYEQADCVTSLFQRALQTQVEIGCPAEKCRVIQNGIHYANFESIAPRQNEQDVHIGAIVRIARIKDIKTMLYAFYELQNRVPNVYLHILGGVDDEQYEQECLQLVEQLHIRNVRFTGVVQVIAYLEKIDFTVLSSISEGQPLSVLESFAARRPCVVTDVGCCRELISGDRGDRLGQAGFVVPPLHKKEMALAMQTLCTDRNLCLHMGEIGRKRVEAYYQHGQMIDNYRAAYKELV